MTHRVTRQKNTNKSTAGLVNKNNHAGEDMHKFTRPKLRRAQFTEFVYKISPMQIIIIKCLNLAKHNGYYIYHLIQLSKAQDFGLRVYSRAFCFAILPIKE
jgi:hypothetical protein